MNGAAPHMPFHGVESGHFPMVKKGKRENEISKNGFSEPGIIG